MAPTRVLTGEGTAAMVSGLEHAVPDSLLATPADLPLLEQTTDPVPLRPVPDASTAGPPAGAPREIRFYPLQMISSLSTVFVVMCLITVLVIFFPAQLGTKADPGLTPPQVKPEWYFLFLYEFLHFSPTMVGLLAPLAGIAGLILLPFLDRNPERAPRRRLLAIASCLLLCAGVVALSIIGYLE